MPQGGRVKKSALANERMHRISSGMPIRRCGYALRYPVYVDAATPYMGHCSWTAMEHTHHDLLDHEQSPLAGINPVYRSHSWYLKPIARVPLDLIRG